jgi:hypothetical protein
MLVIQIPGNSLDRLPEAERAVGDRKLGRRGHRTGTGPMPVMISRSGRCPWRAPSAGAIIGELVGMAARQGRNLGLDSLPPGLDGLHLCKRPVRLLIITVLL